MPKINYLAVIVGAVTYFLLGGVWYTVFGNKFVQLMAWSPEKLAQIEQQGAAKELAITFLGLLLMAYIMAHFIHYTGAKTALEGAVTALWLWLGFVVVTNFNSVTFEFRPLGLYLINIGYHLVGMAFMGALLALWRAKERG